VKKKIFSTFIIMISFYQSNLFAAAHTDLINTQRDFLQQIALEKDETIKELSRNLIKVSNLQIAVRDENTLLKAKNEALEKKIKEAHKTIEKLNKKRKRSFLDSDSESQTHSDSDTE
jgi:peptidoglycan hydrolase CwlO-like protein